MTMWTPEIATDADPKYRALVEALERDIQAGVLSPGTRLPTQRDLAHRLGLAIGTVSRAYATAERAGLVSGEVGRGTFVRTADNRHSEGEDLAAIDLSHNRLVRSTAESGARDALTALIDRADLDALVNYYQPSAGLPRHREALARWASRPGAEVPADRVVVTSGAQHATSVVLSALTRPGDVVLAEQVTYAGLKALASLLHLQLRGVALDAEGLRPDALDAACREHRPRLICCMPTLQNPTATTMSAERRAAIVEVAARYDVMILEDDVYGFLAPAGLLPLAAIAPDRTYHVGSTSKSLAPGLRIGYIVAPDGAAERLAAVIRASTWLASPVTAEVVASWIESGRAAALVEWKRAEVAARIALAVERLGSWLPRPVPPSFHLWLSLPEPWRTEAFVAEARARGVVVTPSAEFVVGREPAPHAVRVCVGAPSSRERLAHGLDVLATLLWEPPLPALRTT